MRISTLNVHVDHGVHQPSRGTTQNCLVHPMQRASIINRVTSPPPPIGGVPPELPPSLRHSPRRRDAPKGKARPEGPGGGQRQRRWAVLRVAGPGPRDGLGLTLVGFGLLPTPQLHTMRREAGKLAA